MNQGLLLVLYATMFLTYHLSQCIIQKQRYWSMYVVQKIIYAVLRKQN